jgi:hypothetical protein
MKPATTALADQAAAATIHATSLLTGLRAADGDSYRPRTQGAVTTALIRKLNDRLDRGQLDLCGHLSWTAPEPVFWCPWAPGRLRCAHCTETVQVRTRGTTEDRRCDACRAIAPLIHAQLMRLPAVVADDIEPRCLPPVIIIFGLCTACQDADTNTEEHR